MTLSQGSDPDSSHSAPPAHRAGAGPLQRLHALDARRVLTLGDDPVWDRVLVARPDVARVVLVHGEYPDVHFVRVDPYEFDEPFGLQELTGSLKELLLSCWEEEGDLRNALALEVLASPLTPESVEYLARGRFPWDETELGLLAGSDLLTPDLLAELVSDLHADQDDLDATELALGALEGVCDGLARVLWRLLEVVPYRSAASLVPAALLLVSAPAPVVEAFLALLPDWSGSDVECFQAASRL